MSDKLPVARPTRNHSGFFAARAVFPVAAAVLAFLLVWLYIRPPMFLQAVERQIYDHLLRSTAQDTHPSHCAIVAIDDQSLETFGQWPWPRYRIALLLEKIRRMQPTAIGLDILFPEADRLSLDRIREMLRKDLNLEVGFTGVPEAFLDYDRVLADILGKGPYVLGYDCRMQGAVQPVSCTLHPISIARMGESFDTPSGLSLLNVSAVLCSIAELGQAVASSGFLNVLPDPDGLVRRIPLLVRQNENILPALSLAVAAQARQRRQLIWKTDSFTGPSLRLAEIDIPIGDGAQLWICYPKTIDSWKPISAVDVLEDRVDPERLFGKMVFVGVTAAGLGDTVPTPIHPMVSGVHLHSLVAENLLAGRFLRAPSWMRMCEGLVSVVIVGLIAVVVAYAGVGMGAGVTALLCVMGWMGASEAMVRYALVISPLFPMLAAGVGFPVFLIIRFVRESYWKRYFRSAFVKTAIQAQRFRVDKEAADRASRHKSDFLAHMSHEIRTPMNAILGIAEVLSEISLSEEQRQYVQTLYQSGEILLDIINDILDLSKIEAGQLQLETISFDIRTLFRQTVEVMSVQARKKGIPIALQVDEAIPKSVQGDPMRVRQILVNLLGNAVKFTDRGSIRVCLDPVKPGSHDGGVVFRVQDSGVGIAPERLESIFSPYSQEKASTTRKYGGTGLGLTISKRLAELMGGTIRVESDVGKGSTFIVELLLPVADKGAEVASEATLQADAGPETLSPRHLISVPGLRVLLAEDVAVNRRVVELYLKDTGVVLQSVENGKEALDRHRSEIFDVILMDMEMPVMDGLEATAAIREWEAETARKPVPIVALTAHAFEEKRQQCFDAGCTHYLTKPVKKSDLLTLLERIGANSSSLRQGE